jgi:hypothetical protein
MTTVSCEMLNWIHKTQILEYTLKLKTVRFISLVEVQSHIFKEKFVSEGLKIFGFCKNT